MTTISDIRSAIETSRKELLDLSLRNPLLNYRSSRARGVEVVGEDAAQAFKSLVSDGRTMSFVHSGLDDAESPVSQAWQELNWSIAANQSDRRLQTAESPAALQRRLLTTYRLANSAIEETGVNTLFLALGMLRWYESDSSQEERWAPLLLVPVKLERTGVRESFNVRYTGDDLGVNLSFLEKAREEFRLTLPGSDFLEPDDGQDIDVVRYIARVEAVIREGAPARWMVEANRIVLGFFSFNKLLMFLDLANPAVAKNGIISALFGDGFAEPAPPIPDYAQLDGHLRPQSTFHVLDADSSQSLAIHDATLGQPLVIQGPPGTGKSQTITNIIAESVAQGKRVLFVSEKMAALEVVKRRLDAIGLGSPCLELHSHKTNKRETLDELNRTLNLHSQPFLDNGEDLLDQLGRTRQQLNDYAEAVNTPVGKSGITPHHAFGKLLQLGQDANPIPWKELSGIQTWSGSDYARRREAVQDLQSRIPRAGPPRNHPFWGSRLQRILLPGEREELRLRLAAAGQGLQTLEQAATALTGKLNLSNPESPVYAQTLLQTADLAREAPNLSGLDLVSPLWGSHAAEIGAMLEQGIRWRQIHPEYGSIFLPGAWSADLGGIRQVLNATGRSFFGRVFSSEYKQARSRLAGVLVGDVPKDVNSQIGLIDAISAARRLRTDLGSKHADAARVLGSRWNRHNTDWDLVVPAVQWWQGLHTGVAAGRVSPETISILRDAPVRPGDQAWQTGALRAGADHLRQALNGYQTAVRNLESALDMDNPLRFGNRTGLPALDFAVQHRTLSGWEGKLPDLDELISFNSGATAARNQGLHAVIAVAEQDPRAAASLLDWFDRAWYESVVDSAYDQRPALRDFHGDAHRAIVDRFRTLDEQYLNHNRLRVAQIHRQISACHQELPDRLVRVAQSGMADDGDQGDVRRRQLQLRVLQREIEKKARHKPIRKLIHEAGSIIQELKPVFMMSPLSIANYLAPDSVEFDLVVFDEASQVRPVDALGALFRAKNAVVVGDRQQLPPSRFFDRMVESGDDDSEEEESVTADIESILGLFASKGAPSRQLHWHYRSRHESLIAVSNREFYDNNLVVFPSPDAGREENGLRFHHLPDSVYGRGGSRTNPEEARAVVDAVMQHAIQNPELSLGVAAFSQLQARAIDDHLEIRRRQDDSAEEFFSSHPEEPFFVKNLENVQGDERDVIFISVGYGRDATGQVSHNFGPLNNQGGGRRLNVLITRAKRQCHVFTSLRADDIDLARTASEGVRVLKTFLAYAQTGFMPDDVPYESGFTVDSPFQEEVARRLQERGYQVHQEVASYNKFVDIGVVDPERPGRYIIGIECDGASYHSSRSARDRDRLRQMVLEDKGWKLYRIWSTDWFRSPDRELERAVRAIEEARRLG